MTNRCQLQTKRRGNQSRHFVTYAIFLSKKILVPTSREELASLAADEALVRWRIPWWGSPRTRNEVPEPKSQVLKLKCHYRVTLESIMPLPSEDTLRSAELGQVLAGPHPDIVAIVAILSRHATRRLTNHDQFKSIIRTAKFVIY